MRKSLIAASLLSAVVAAPAFAEDAPSAPPVTGNFTIASEYIFRGIAQTNNKPAFQGGFDYAHSSGFYLGTWGSNVSWLSDGSGLADFDGDGVNDSISNSLELDLYGGYKFSAGPVGFDFGMLQYYYPGKYPNGMTKPNTLEAYGAVSWSFLTFKYSYATGNLFGFTDSKGSSYPELNASYDVGGGFTLTGHVGHQKVKGNGLFSYTDYKVGVTKDLGGFLFGLAYSDTTSKNYVNVFGTDLGKGRLIATVGKTF